MGAPKRAMLCPWAHQSAQGCALGRTKARRSAPLRAQRRTMMRPWGHQGAQGCAIGGTKARKGALLGTPRRVSVRPWAHQGAQGCVRGRSKARKGARLCAPREDKEAPRLGGEGAGLPFPPLASVQSSAQCAAFRAHQPKREPIRQPNDWVSALGCTRRAARMRRCAQRAYTCALHAWPTLAARMNHQFLVGAMVGQWWDREGAIINTGCDAWKWQSR